MHSTEWSNDEVTVCFNHNGDFSGDVKIRIIKAPSDVVHAYEFGGRAAGMPEPEYVDLEDVPFAALKALVAKYARGNLVARLENASDDEILEWVW